MKSSCCRHSPCRVNQLVFAIYQKSKSNEHASVVGQGRPPYIAMLADGSASSAYMSLGNAHLDQSYLSEMSR